jgi:hypothetical protein
MKVHDVYALKGSYTPDVCIKVFIYKGVLEARLCMHSGEHLCAKYTQRCNINMCEDTIFPAPEILPTVTC